MQKPKNSHVLYQQLHCYSCQDTKQDTWKVKIKENIKITFIYVIKHILFKYE
jgi:hypothetical protein